MDLDGFCDTWDSTRSTFSNEFGSLRCILINLAYDLLRPIRIRFSSIATDRTEISIQIKNGRCTVTCFSDIRIDRYQVL